MPNYNKGKFIKETLDSVLNQSYTNWECIIVDDHSTDDSWQVIESFAVKDSRFRVYKRPAELAKGGNVCRNYAFREAKGDYIIYLDSDDILAKWCVKERISNSLMMSDYDLLVYPGMIFKNSPGDSNLIWNQINDIHPIYRFLYGDIPWSITGPFFKRSFLVTNNIIWDESLLDWQDADYNLRALLAGANTLEMNSIPDYFVRSSSVRNNNVSRGEFKTANIESRCSMFSKWTNLIQSSKVASLNLSACRKMLAGNMLIQVRTIILSNTDFNFDKWFKSVYKIIQNPILAVILKGYIFLLIRFRKRRGFHFFIFKVVEPLIPGFYLKRNSFPLQVELNKNVYMSVLKTLNS